MNTPTPDESGPTKRPEHNLIDHPQSVLQLRAKAEKLWQLLDDISTAFDQAKPELEWFERKVWCCCESRREHFKTDGEKLFATQSMPDENRE
jgi:hypothetical protein